MSSIGPQLPPHLSKRKRTPDDESPDSPTAKLQATDRNRNEVNLNSDDESSYGPPLPPSLTKGPIGPSLPPSNTDEVELDDSDDDAIGPSAPPPPSTARPKSKPSVGPTLPPANRDEIPLEDANSSDDSAGPAPPPPKRVLGPAAPPAPLSSRPPADPASDSDSDSDYGPALPTSTSHQARQTAALAAASARAGSESSKPQRDDWMLAPPTSTGYRAGDPTQLKSRKFQSGPRTNTSTDKGGGGEIASIWTETPEQKRRRLEDAVLGRDPGASQAHTQTRSAAHSTLGVGKEDLDPEQAARIRGFTEATRGRSLYEEHQASRKGRELAPDEEEDDPSKRAFDREKDVRSGSRINTAQRRELMSRAADFGGRFAKGKYL
ncbi:hypothetical protein F4781DRAFT_387449 [Annulohypoxylon bovei var. microspora]|nr:hypothetical protein F4781DRAFT_387449 [Annulohypoxylon bovei var. microspora]